MITGPDDIVIGMAIEKIAGPLLKVVVTKVAKKCAGLKGGTYRLINEAGEVMKTGRTKELARREKELGRKHPDLEFKVDKRTDVYSQQRGREEIIYNEQNPPAALDKIRPINPDNPNAARYRRAARNL